MDGTININGYDVPRYYDGVPSGNDLEMMSYKDVIAEFVASKHLCMDIVYESQYNASTSKQSFKRIMEKYFADVYPKYLRMAIINGTLRINFDRNSFDKFSGVKKEKNMERPQDVMITLEELIEISNKGNASKKVGQLKTPIELRKYKRKDGKIAIKLCIRDDVNGFSKQQFWHKAYHKKYNRLYFYYGRDDVKALKVGESKGYHWIQFTDEDVAEKMECDSKAYYWHKDESLGLYYIEP